MGVDQSMVQYLTVKRLAPGSITIKAVTGDIEVDVDSPKGKRVKKGSNLSLSSKAKRAVVRERPHR